MLLRRYHYLLIYLSMVTRHLRLHSWWTGGRIVKEAARTERDDKGRVDAAAARLLYSRAIQLVLLPGISGIRHLRWDDTHYPSLPTTAACRRPPAAENTTYRPPRLHLPCYTVAPGACAAPAVAATARTPPTPPHTDVRGTGSERAIAISNRALLPPRIASVQILHQRVARLTTSLGDAVDRTITRDCAAYRRYPTPPRVSATARSIIR